MDGPNSEAPVYSINEPLETKKDPWLAVSLSWMFPGAGQLYIGKYLRGVVFLGFDILFFITSSMLLLVSRCSIFVPILLVLLRKIIIYGYGCIDAFILTKKNFNRTVLNIKKPWLAVFLSILIPGLGHLYLRKWKYFLLYFFTFFLIPSLYPFEVIEPASSLIIRILSASHAYFASAGVSGKKAFFVFAIFMVTIFLNNELVSPYFYGKYAGGFSHHFSGSSMEPTIKSNDEALISKIYYLWGRPKCGDIVAFKIPDQLKNKIKEPSTKRFCKRIIAVGGEEVYIEEDKIFINGRIREFSQLHRSINSQDVNNIDLEQRINKKFFKYGVSSPYTVPQGCYFVLGDNLNYSMDSRFFGAISQEDIEGKVVRIFWPLDRIAVLH